MKRETHADTFWVARNRCTVRRSLYEPDFKSLYRSAPPRAQQSTTCPEEAASETGLSPIFQDAVLEILLGQGRLVYFPNEVAALLRKLIGGGGFIRLSSRAVIRKN
jgi:hypothetical protein